MKNIFEEEGVALENVKIAYRENNDDHYIPLWPENIIDFKIIFIVDIRYGVSSNLIVCHFNIFDLPEQSTIKNLQVAPIICIGSNILRFTIIEKYEQE